jgi:DNA-binding transcriptional LysR family regulator
MEIRQLRYFVAVADERHFRRAAARLHVAQPAVSEQIRKLEGELGVRLLDRDSRRVELTSAGAAFLEEARHVLSGIDVAVQEAQRANALGAARIRLGYTLPALSPAITGVLARLRTARSPVCVELVPGPSRSLLERVRRGELEAAVVALPAPFAALRLLALGSEPVVALVPGRAAATPEPIALAKVAPRLLLPARDIDPAWTDAVMGAFHRADIAPHVVSTAASTTEHLLLEVLGGAGVAMLPASTAARHVVPGVVARPLADSALVLPTAVAVRQGSRSPVLSCLLDELALAAEPTVRSVAPPVAA